MQKSAKDDAEWKTTQHEGIGRRKTSRNYRSARRADAVGGRSGSQRLPIALGIRRFTPQPYIDPVAAMRYKYAAVVKKIWARNSQIQKCGIGTVVDIGTSPG